MFKKLVKHEFIASYRSYLPIYLAIIVFSFVTPLTRQIDVIQLTSAATTILGILIEGQSSFSHFTISLLVLVKEFTVNLGIYYLQRRHRHTKLYYLSYL